MRTRAIIVSAFLITIAAAATAATVEAPFTAVVISPNTTNAHVRITANPKLVATIAADVNVRIRRKKTPLAEVTQTRVWRQ